MSLLSDRTRAWITMTKQWTTSNVSQVDKIVIGSCASVLLVLIMASLHDRNELKRSEAERTALLSNGAFDHHAEIALTDLTQRPRSDLDAHQLFLRAQLRDLNLHEGHRPTHTRSHEAEILNDYVATLTKPGNDRWMRQRIQDFLDRRQVQFQALNIPVPVQYNDLQHELDIQRYRVYDHETAPGLEGSLQRLEASKDWKTNDTQNVHDSGVHNSLRDMLARLKEKDNEVVTPLGLFDVTEDMMRHIQTGDFSDEVKRKAMIACHNGSRSNASHPSLSDLNEQQVMNLVWRRSYHPANNKEQQTNIKDMFVHNLADTITSDANVAAPEQVCVTGRIGRIVDALTLTDTDSMNVGQPLSLDMMRNDIFEYAQKQLQTKVQHFANITDDTRMRDVAKSYDDMSIQVNAEEEEQFKASVIEDTAEYIHRQYGELISSAHQQDIMSTVQNAI